MKALSFLGAGNYQPVTYVWQDRTSFTHLFPQAVAEIFAPEKVVVFVTPGVKTSSYFYELQNILGDRMYPVDIPEGKSEQELWEIFECCTGVVEENDEILLDITHAFRSLPLFLFTVAAYLRKAKNVTVRHIVYGAYDARTSSGDGSQVQVPIFDLAPLLDLLDWLSGAEFFKKRGDALLLAENIRDVHQEAWRKKFDTELPEKLKSLADELQRLSWAVALVHPLEFMQRAWKLRGLFQAVREEAARWAKPFSVILGEIEEEIVRFADPAPETLSKEHLLKQLDFAVYLFEKGLVLQASLLAREWLINYVLLKVGRADWLDRKVREEVEEALGAAKVKLEEKEAHVPEWFTALPEHKDIAEVWNTLTTIRNDLAHCGMSQKSHKSASVASRVQGILEDLKGLFSGVPSWSLRGDVVTIDLRSLYGDVARLEELPRYLEKLQNFAVEGKEVTITGQAPVWLYLAVAHALHGKAKRLFYGSPVTGDVLIFDHAAR